MTRDPVCDRLLKFDNTLDNDIVSFYVILQRQEHDNLVRIMNVVQNHPDFFSALAGHSVFAAVADMLERLVKGETE